MFDLYGTINLNICRLNKRIEPTLVEKAIQAVPGFLTPCVQIGKTFGWFWSFVGLRSIDSKSLLKYQ
jgi:hypothetical protein